MKTLKEYHKEALNDGWAVPHFNFSSLAQLQGIMDAVREAKAPAVVGTSEGERKFVGMHQAVYLVNSFREKEGIPLFLNSDHSHSFESAKEAFDVGYTSIHVDLSKKPFNENIEETRQVVDYVKEKNEDVEVEGELGYLATDSSKIYDKEVDIPEDSYTNVEKAVEYVEKTNVDRFAPAIGNLHGIAANEPKVRFDLVEELRKALPDVTFVLHGGSGISDEDMKKLVGMGFNNIHVSTELRVAYSDALRNALKENAEEVAPYNYLKEPRESVAQVVKSKLELYGCANKA